MRKKGIVSEYLPWLLIAIAFLVLMMFAIFFLREGSFHLIDKIKGFFK
jgi:uncharacterized protein YoxC